MLDNQLVTNQLKLICIRVGFRFVESGKKHTFAKKPSPLSGAMDTYPLFEFSDRAELRQWLEENHGTTPFCWVATTRGKEPRCGAIPYPEVVEECLCFGWIDSTAKRLDEGRQAQRISPRKKGSTWTILNTRRFRDLDERGLVTEAGWKAVPLQREISPMPPAAPRVWWLRRLTHGEGRWPCTVLPTRFR